MSSTDSDQHVAIDIYSLEYKQKVQSDFIHVFEEFSKVINDNVLIIGEEYLYEYEKKHMNIESKRKRRTPDTPTRDVATQPDPPWVQHGEYAYIVTKIEDVQKRLVAYIRALDYYYIGHKWLYDIISVCIIMISSSMTFFEAMSMSFEFGRYQKLITVMLSSSIAALTSFLKFKNYKEKAEEIVRIKEKVLSSQSKLYLFEKDLKSKLHLYKKSLTDESTGRD